MKKTIIFGNNQFAELANYYLSVDSEKIVECFCVDEEHKDRDRLNNIPVFSFEYVCRNYSPEFFDFFVPLYSNELRFKISKKIESFGYELISYISSKSHTWNSKIGKNCFIFEGVNIQPFCFVGDNVIIWSFSHIGHHSVVKSNSFISGNVVVAGNNTIEENCFLGTNCTTKNGIKICKNTTIGQDASVVKSILEENNTWVGVPAKILGT